MLLIVLIIENMIIIALLLVYRFHHQNEISKVRLLTIQDPLTHLYNRRGFEEMLERIRSLSSRSGNPFAVLLIDADHFKSINDKHGHSMGDEVLRAIGYTIREQCRTSDVVARIGGEEFAVILPDTSKDGAIVVAERIRQRIQMDLAVKYPHIMPTVSIGVSTDDRMKSILDNADRKLYKAKKTGRNKVVA